MDRRQWIAALTSLAMIAWLRQAGETPAAAFSLGFPLLILSGSSLWRRLQSSEQDRGRGVSLLALLLLAPVVATRSWNEINASDFMRYIAPIDHVVVSVMQASSALSGVGAFLAFVALTLAIIGGRQSFILVGGILAACVVSVALEFQLDAVAVALRSGDVDLAQTRARWAGWHGLFAIVPGAFIGWFCFRRMGGVLARWEWGGHLLALVVVAWIVRPTLPALLRFPVPVQGTELPTAEPGISVPLPALDPWADDFMERAIERGSSPRQKEWSCSGRDTKQWLGSPRLSVAMAADANEDLSSLDVILTDLYARAIHRVHLVGQATPGPGPLHQALSNPTLPLILAAPPEGAHWVAWSEAGLDWVVGGEPSGDDAICVLLPLNEPTIGELYDQGRALLEERGCRALSLLPQPWRSQIQLPLTSDPGCSKKGPWGNG